MSRAAPPATPIVVPMAHSLTVKIGSDQDSMAVACCNDEENPMLIKNEHFEGHVLVRVQNFKGVVPENSERIATTPYFDGRKRLMSFQVQATFAKEWSGDDLVWSQDWENPLAAPKMIGLFTKFWSMTDPGSFSEINSQTPYMRSFVVTAMCTISSWPSAKKSNDDEEPFRPILVEDINALLPADAITKRTTALAESKMSKLSFNTPPNSGPGTPAVASILDQETSEEPEEMGEGPSADEIAAATAEVTCTTPSSMSSPVSTPSISSSFFRRATSSQPTPVMIQQALSKEIKSLEKIQRGGEDAVRERRKFFASEDNRKEAVFKPNEVYGFEIFNPNFDPNNWVIKIPGITIDLAKVTNGQPMRLRLMSKDGQTVFFVVEVSVTQPETVPGTVEEKGTLS
ncbi:hypothetical protein HDU98_001961, partial [Podochytrium sp. JEL0797]